MRNKSSGKNVFIASKCYFSSVFILPLCHTHSLPALPTPLLSGDFPWSAQSSLFLIIIVLPFLFLLSDYPCLSSSSDSWRKECLYIYILIQAFAAIPALIILGSAGVWILAHRATHARYLELPLGHECMHTVVCFRSSLHGIHFLFQLDSYRLYLLMILPHPSWSEVIVEVVKQCSLTNSHLRNEQQRHNAFDGVCHCSCTLLECASVGIWMLQLPLSTVSIIHTTRKSSSFSKGFPLRSLSHWLSVRCASLTQAHLQSSALLCPLTPLPHHRLEYVLLSCTCFNDDLLWLLYHVQCS